MSNSGNVACNPVSKTLSAGSMWLGEPGRAWSTRLFEAWKWLTRHSRGVLARGASRRLKVAEIVSLGEKRFISILQVDGEQFLIGGSPSTIVLLAKLEARSESPGVEERENAVEVTR